MIKSEQALWSYIKYGLEMCEVDLQRIETGATSLGVFDVNALHAGVEIWIELKFHHSPLRPEQKGWCVRRLQYGGRLWIISENRLNGSLEIWNGRDAIIHKRYPSQPNHIFPRPIRWITLRDTLFEERMIWTRGV